MRRLRQRSAALAIAAWIASGAAVLAQETPPLPPLRPPELGGPPAVEAPDEGLAAASPGATAPAPPPAREQALAAPAAREAEPETEATEGQEPAPGDGAIAPAEVLEAERPAFELKEAEACEAELRRLGAAFTVAEPLEEAGCGARRPLALTALPGGVEVEGEQVLLRCEAALAAARWLEQVVQPSARLHLGTSVESLVVSTSYFCRGRAGSGTPSQHAFANALDVLGLRFADASVMLIAPRPGSPDPERAFQAAIRGGACAYFTTVLGPTTNAAHVDHLHLDVKRRDSGYRVCE